MELFYLLAILLLVSRAFGALAALLGQPSLVGELIAGITLGLILHGTGLDLTSGGPIVDDEVFVALTELGVFFLMLMAGMELQPDEFRESSVSSFFIALSGMLLPLAAGFGLGWWLLPDSDMLVAQSLFLGTALAITAVPVAARVLLDLGQLNSRIGRTIISAAVVDDVLSLILLALLTGLIEQGGLPGATGFALLIAKAASFFAGTWLLGRYVIPVIGRLVGRLGVEEIEISTLLTIGFGYAFLAELAGLHFIVGAFLAGLYFRSHTFGEAKFEEVSKRLSGLTSGFLAPFFFVSIGLHVTAGALLEVPLFVAALILLAFVSKLVGAGVPAAFSGFDRRESLGIGIAMSGRGAVELIIADIALRAGLFALPDTPSPILANMFSAIVIMAIVTTIATPLLLRPLFAGHPSSGR